MQRRRRIIMNLNQIDTTLTGKLLITTLAKLSTCSEYSHLTPDEIFSKIQNNCGKVYDKLVEPLTVKSIPDIKGTTKLFEKEE